MIDFKSIFDFTKLPTKIFVVLSIVSGVFLFSTEKNLKIMHFDKFEKYGGYVGIVFIFSVALVMINFFVWIYNKIERHFKMINLKKEFKETIENLDHKEKAVLREFAIQGQNSIEVPYDDTIVSGLIDKGVLRFNKQLGGSFIANGSNVSMSLSKFVSKILELEHIGLSKELSEEEKEIINESRPEWTRKWRY